MMCEHTVFDQRPDALGTEDVLQRMIVVVFVAGETGEVAGVTESAPLADTGVGRPVRRAVGIEDGALTGVDRSCEFQVWIVRSRGVRSGGILVSGVNLIRTRTQWKSSVGLSLLAAMTNYSSGNTSDEAARYACLGSAVSPIPG